jgi:hypothetical protein
MGSILHLGVWIQPQPLGHPQTISIFEVTIVDVPSNLCLVVSWKYFSVWFVEKVCTSRNSIFFYSPTFITIIWT